MSKRLRAPACGLVVSLAVLIAPAVAAAAQSSSLRLFAAESHVTVPQIELRAGLVQLGVWVAPVGGGFQIDLRRPGYGSWSAEQVDAGNGSTVQPVPIGMVDPARGLKRFLSLSFVDAAGRVAAHRLVTFCPNGESARLDDSGPLQPTYPLDCVSAGFFPFVRGIVWGIDPGWAVEPALSTFPGFGPGPFGPIPVGALPPRLLSRLDRRGISLKPGRYTAILSITPAYRRLFAIPAAQATAKVVVRVTYSPPPRRPPFGRPIRVATGVFAPAADPPAGPPPMQAHPDPATMPNLVALPAWGIGVRRFGRQELLTFSATIWDAGPAPFSIEGFRRTNSDLMDAYEYFFDAAGNVVGRAPAGTMFYDNGRGHQHWHLRQLAAYTLIGPSGQIVRSHKQSFCIAPTNAVDMTMPGAVRSQQIFGGPGFGGTVCDVYSPDAIWLREQLPAGWGDTYTQAVAGQAFDITHVPNGRYRIEVQVNPLGQLTETTTSDDVAIRFIRLSGRGRERRVTVSPWHGIRG